MEPTHENGTDAPKGRPPHGEAIGNVPPRRDLTGSLPPDQRNPIDTPTR